MIGCYQCRDCDVSGRGEEEPDGQVLCWNCGRPAVVTAILAGPGKLSR